MAKAFRTILILCILAVASFFGAYFLLSNDSSKTQSASLPQPIDQPEQAYAEPRVKTVTSIDGQKKLTMREQTQENSKTYEFTGYDANSTQLFTFSKTVGNDNAMDAPDNAWSPDDKYVFITGTTNGQPEVFALQTTGAPFATGEQTLDVSSLFIEKDSGYTLTEVTGWAAPGLLIVETTKDGVQGPSFWFEIPSKSFIQLSRHQ